MRDVKPTTTRDGTARLARAHLTKPLYCALASPAEWQMTAGDAAAQSDVELRGPSET